MYAYMYAYMRHVLKNLGVYVCVCVCVKRDPRRMQKTGKPVKRAPPRRRSGSTSL